MTDSTCTPAACANPRPGSGVPCKLCYARAWRKANIEKSRAQERERAVRAREKHGQVFNARRRVAYAANPDKVKAEVADYRVRNLTKVRQQERAKSARARAATPDLMRRYVRESGKKYRLENKEAASLKNREYLRARRARKRGGTVDYSSIIRELGMICHLCGGEIQSMSDLHMDHVIPLSRGGEHSRENIKPAHAFCNLSKGTRLTPPIPTQQ